MARKYRSPLREEQKARTVERILAAAVRLHGRGITELEAVAAEAGVSLATLRKHFPTREALFEGCTAHFLQIHPPPDLAPLAAIEDPAERAARVAAVVCAVHEAAFGQVWLAYRLREESPAMAASVSGMEGFVRAAAALVAPGAETGAAVALLHPLTYRALRAAGGLSPAAAVATVTRLLRALFDGDQAE